MGYGIKDYFTLLANAVSVAVAAHLLLCMHLASHKSFQNASIPNSNSQNDNQNENALCIRDGDTTWKFNSIPDMIIICAM